MGVRFLLDGAVHDTGPIDPTTTVLQLLRERLRRTGTKEGCAEGDCGACTVLVGEAAGDALVWRALNACILFVPMIDGRALLTVESLALGGTLGPVQRAMVAAHASQCGFCTPGFVMTIEAKALGAAGTADLAARDLIAGNLCRCTGYGPILDVAEATLPRLSDDAPVLAALAGLRRDDDLALAWDDRRWFAPRKLARFAALVAEHSDAQIVAGATDVGLWVTKGGRSLATVISLAEVDELRTIDETADGLRLGAGVRYVDAAGALDRLAPGLGELLRRFGAVQVRSAGTIGGNIANGSPIGDMPPALIVLGASLVLRRGEDQRTLPLEDFFVRYGVQDRRPGEFVEAIFIPRPGPATMFRVTKLSKRFDSDISAVCGVFAIDIQDGRIVAARVAFGGMAAIPARARACEAALTGAEWCPATLETAARALVDDFTPLSDVRGSAAYRATAAANLVRALWRDEPALLALAAIDG